MISIIFSPIIHPSTYLDAKEIRAPAKRSIVKYHKTFKI
jgi:hypothetical protein